MSVGVVIASVIGVLEMIASLIRARDQVWGLGIRSSTVTSAHRRPMGEAYPGAAPEPWISSIVAGVLRRPALFNFASLSCMSPRITTNTNAPILGCVYTLGP